MNQEIFDRIDALALKFGTTAEYLWPILISAEKVRGNITFYITLLFFIGSGILITAVLKKSEDEDVQIGALVVFVLALVIFFSMLTSNINSIFYPEAAVFKSLVEMF